MFEDIKKSFEKLVALYESERGQRMRLQKELESAKAENAAYKERIIDLERQVDNHKLTEAFTSSSGDNSAAKEKIEKLIKEMDRCISLLEK